MIHSRETMEAIKTALLNAGVSGGEVLDELLDHYLTELESARSTSTVEQDHLQAICTKISDTDFSLLRERKERRLTGYVLPILLLILTSIYIGFQYEMPGDRKVVQEKDDSAPTGWPLADPHAPITSDFSLRLHPISKSPRFHQGIDIKARHGDAVLATGSGVVVETGFTEAAGKYVVIQHNERFASRYYHLSAIDVDADDVVETGTKIGEVGSTGMSLGPHLHYEINDFEAPIDPMEYVRS